MTPDDGPVARLRERLERQRAAGRHGEVVRTLVALGDALPEPNERVAHYLQAAELFVDHFANHAEATRLYEKVFDLDPTERRSANYLREAYEKRRDWEKLAELGARATAQRPGRARG